MATANHTTLYSNHSVPALLHDSSVTSATVTLWLADALRVHVSCNGDGGGMKAVPEGEKEKSKRHHRGTWLITQQDSALSSEKSMEESRGLSAVMFSTAGPQNTPEQCSNYTLAFGECVGLIKMCPVIVYIVQIYRYGKCCIIICTPSSFQIPNCYTAFKFYLWKTHRAFLVKIINI